jgi:hypothetical protein
MKGSPVTGPWDRKVREQGQIEHPSRILSALDRAPGNMQPVAAAAPDGTVPDMHPFHMHLVNFIVQRHCLEAMATVD